MLSFDALLGQGHDEEPLAHYVKLMGTYLFLSAGTFALLERAGRPLPSRIPLRDAALLGLATNRLSRLITRDKVTRAVRAPFTDVEQDPAGQTHEEPRGEGMTRAIGELLTCPRCAAMWASLGLTIGYLVSPRVTRGASFLLGSAAISDFINTCYARVTSAGGK
ncbi:DUF1360 domain-containing protein [Sorangium sp. So ce1335]|uniref:DUF1360 domain-containing protein n=1 Tax=Sorangium sp. So ce1335 TaxID=3133335 RepID=UPI003F603959